MELNLRIGVNERRFGSSAASINKKQKVCVDMKVDFADAILPFAKVLVSEEFLYK